MPVTINGKVIRNVPEQVGKNKRDIHELILSIPTYGKSIELTMDSNYVMTLTLKDAEGHALSHASVDLPLEATVVDGRYDDDTKELILVLQNGNEITIPVAGLISGLAATGSENNFTALQKFAAGIELKASALTGDYRVVCANNSELSFIYWDNGAIAATPLKLYSNGKSVFGGNVEIGTQGQDFFTLKFCAMYGSGQIYYNNSQEFVMSLWNGTQLKWNNSALYTPDGKDLGTPSYPWKDGYFSGQLSAQNTFNAINASDIGSGNVLTQDQYDLFTNGKPTIVKGTFFGLQDPIFFVSGQTASVVYGGIYSGDGTSAFYLAISTKILTKYGATQGRINLNSIGTINGKIIPAYPASTGTFVLKCVDGTLTWVQE